MPQIKQDRDPTAANASLIKDDESLGDDVDDIVDVDDSASQGSSSAASEVDSVRAVSAASGASSDVNFAVNSAFENESAADVADGESGTAAETAVERALVLYLGVEIISVGVAPFDHGVVTVTLP